MITKKFPSIYLISPPSIEITSFKQELEPILELGIISIFQLRLKGIRRSEIEKITKELLSICNSYKCKLILNDFIDIALEVGADGVHLGLDGEDDLLEEDYISLASKKSSKLENFIIGASCYDSKELALLAVNQGASYVSFGSFFPTQTKVTRSSPDLEILRWAKENIKIPIVAIGGINSSNCKTLIEAGADSVAVISAIWNHKDGAVCAVKEMQNILN